MLTSTPVQRERLLEQLRGLDDTDLFDLLPVQMQTSLNDAFCTSWLDSDDHICLALLVKDYDVDQLSEWSVKLDRLWAQFLKNKDLLNDSVLGPAIQQAYLEANDEEV